MANFSPEGWRFVDSEELKAFPELALGLYQIDDELEGLYQSAWNMIAGQLCEYGSLPEEQLKPLIDVWALNQDTSQEFIRNLVNDVYEHFSVVCGTALTQPISIPDSPPVGIGNYPTCLVGNNSHVNMPISWINYPLPNWQEFKKDIGDLYSYDQTTNKVILGIRLNDDMSLEGVGGKIFYPYHSVNLQDWIDRTAFRGTNICDPSFDSNIPNTPIPTEIQDEIDSIINDPYPITDIIPDIVDPIGNPPNQEIEDDIVGNPPLPPIGNPPIGNNSSNLTCPPTVVQCPPVNVNVPAPIVNVTVNPVIDCKTTSPQTIPENEETETKPKKEMYWDDTLIIEYLQKEDYPKTYIEEMRSQIDNILISELQFDLPLMSTELEGIE